MSDSTPDTESEILDIGSLFRGREVYEIFVRISHYYTEDMLRFQRNKYYTL